MLGFSPKFGALILTIPGPVLGGLSIVRVRPDRRDWRAGSGSRTASTSPTPRNLITAAVTLTAGAGDLTLKFGGFTLGGIGTATFGAIILYQILTSPLARRAE